MGKVDRSTTLDRSIGERGTEILDAAARAFMRQGFAATSLDRISDEINSTKGAIYYYYRSKSDLFFAVHRRAMEFTEAAIRPPFESDRTPRDRLHAMACAHTLLIMNQLPYLRVAAQGLELHLLERTNESERAELAEVAALRESNEALYISAIEQGIAAGELRSMDARLIAKPLLGALNWTSRWYHPRSDETDDSRHGIAHSIADFVIAGLEKK
jgi:AcrR family transcriptional regulator